MTSKIYWAKIGRPSSQSFAVKESCFVPLRVCGGSYCEISWAWKLKGENRRNWAPLFAERNVSNRLNLALRLLRTTKIDLVSE